MPAPPSPAVQPAFPWSADRFTLLARLAMELERGNDPESAAALRQALGAGAKAVPPEHTRPLLGQLEGATALRSAADAAPPAARPGLADTGGVPELLKQRASLELKLAQETQARKDVEAALAKHKEEHQIAMESLALQRQKVKELQEDRAKNLTDIRRIEDQLRVQINECEQLQIKLQKLQDARKSVSDQAVDQAEELNALRAENESLRQKMEAVLQERDQVRQSAQAEVAVAESQTADAVLQVLWTQMSTEWPELCPPTHVPTQRTFENLCESFLELVRAMAIIEAHNLAMLKDMRQIGEAGDKLANYYLAMTKNPNLVATIREYLPSQRRGNNVAQLLRSLQGWARALSTGLNKVILRAPDIIRDELNYRNWPIKIGFTTGEDAPVGKYFRETVYKTAPDVVGTKLRRLTGDLMYQDFTDLWKQKR